jgi:hypothetical protein
VEHASAINSLKPHFRFPLRGDRVAERFLIGSALFLGSLILPILPALFVVGYAVQVMRRATAGEAPSMHAWQDWGAMLKDGFRAWVISFLFFLPGTIVLLAGYGAYFASFLSMGALSGNETDATFVLPFLLGMASLFLGLGLGSLLFVLASIPLPVALAHFAAEDKFAAAFRFRQWWRVLRANPLGFLIGWVVVVGLIGVVYFFSLTAYFTLVLICLLPLLLLPAFFYVILVGASLFGDLYAEGRAKVQELSP